jgi:hypothetical protein
MGIKALACSIPAYNVQCAWVVGKLINLGAGWVINQMPCMGIIQFAYLSIPTHNVCLAPVLINLRHACAVNHTPSIGIK